MRIIRTFRIIAHSVSGRVEGTESGEFLGTPIKAFLAKHFPDYVWTGGIAEVYSLSMWRTEAYNATHGLDLFILEQ